MSVVEPGFVSLWPLTTPGQDQRASLEALTVSTWMTHLLIASYLDASTAVAFQSRVKVKLLVLRGLLAYSQALVWRLPGCLARGNTSWTVVERYCRSQLLTSSDISAQIVAVTNPPSWTYCPSVCASFGR